MRVMFIRRALLASLAMCGWAICGCVAISPPCVECVPPIVTGPIEMVEGRSRPPNVRPASVKAETPAGNQMIDRSSKRTPPNDRPGSPDSRGEELPIDLPTALRLADASNPQVAVAREQIRQALARVDAADVLWLPAIRPGINYDHHEGSIENINGNQFNTARSNFYSGLGAGMVGAGPAIFPGVFSNFSLADAFFQPLAARQYAAGRRRAAAAVTNDTLLLVAQTYLDLLRAVQDLAIAKDIVRHTQQVADLTSEYAKTGEGLQSDADRLHVELTIRKNDVLRADESRQVAATRLAQLLHIDPTTGLEPAEPVVVAIELVPAEVDLHELVAQGLSTRPELAESRQLVSEAVTRLRRERLSPLVPSMLLGTSYGAMGAGVNSSLAPATGRLDVDVVAYWQMRNLGLGDRAAQHEAQSSVQQARLRQVGLMDQVAREITEAYSQSQARRQQIAIAREGVRAAAASYRRNLARIENVKGLPIEVLQSVQALALARREYLRTLIDFDQAQFSLYRAIGWPGSAAGGMDRRVPTARG
jgi:outer membrane protein TolC